MQPFLKKSKWTVPLEKLVKEIPPLSNKWVEKRTKRGTKKRKIFVNQNLWRKRRGGIDVSFFLDFVLLSDVCSACSVI